MSFKAFCGPALTSLPHVLPVSVNLLPSSHTGLCVVPQKWQVCPPLGFWATSSLCPDYSPRGSCLTNACRSFKAFFRSCFHNVVYLKHSIEHYNLPVDTLMLSTHIALFCLIFCPLVLIIFQQPVYLCLCSLYSLSLSLSRSSSLSPFYAAYFVLSVSLYWNIGPPREAILVCFIHWCVPTT